MKKSRFGPYFDGYMQATRETWELRQGYTLYIPSADGYTLTRVNSFGRRLTAELVRVLRSYGIRPTIFFNGYTAGRYNFHNLSRTERELKARQRELEAWQDFSGERTEERDPTMYPFPNDIPAE